MKVAIRGSRDLTFVELRRFAKLCDPPASSEIGDPRASRISDHENGPSGYLALSYLAQPGNSMIEKVGSFD